jgi:O-antigen/teichoic acid export membrane protein
MRAIEWFRDHALRRLLRFGVPIALSKLATSFLGLVTMALLAHHLGPAKFGVIAVIRTLISVVDSYASSSASLAIIKYGTQAIAEGKRHDVQRLIKLGLTIEVFTCTLGAIVAAAVAFAVPSAFGWTSHEASLCALYALAILSHFGETPDGVFRLCDAYRVQAIATSLGGLAMTVAVAIAVGIGGSFDTCVMALLAGEIFGNLLVLAAGLWVARRGGFGGWMQARLEGWREDFPGIVRFLVSISAQQTVKKSQSELDMFVVGAMLGKAASGLLRVIKQLGTIPGRAFMPFEQVLFTELARCSATGDYSGFRRLLVRTVAIFATCSLVMWLVVSAFAEPIVDVVAGTDFLPAVPALRWYFLAMVLGVTNAPVLRAMIALGRPGTLFLFDVSTLGLLFVTSILGTYFWGLTGLAIALVVHKSIQLAWSTILTDRIVQRRQASPAS